jgi:hypothetical protein
VLPVDAPEGYQHVWRKARAGVRARPAPPRAPSHLHEPRSRAQQGNRAPGAAAATRYGPCTMRSCLSNAQWQVLVALAGIEARALEYSYFFHADDDSLLRLDLLAPLLVGFCRGLWELGGCRCCRAANGLCTRQRFSGSLTLDSSHPRTSTHLMRARAHSAPLQEASPRERFYWGYIWNAGSPGDGGGRTTAPIRNPGNKSHMPIEQVGCTRPGPVRLVMVWARRVLGGSRRAAAGRSQPP